MQRELPTSDGRSAVAAAPVDVAVEVAVAS
jgi:hypothetical protein